MRCYNVLHVVVAAVALLVGSESLAVSAESKTAASTRGSSVVSTISRSLRIAKASDLDSEERGFFSQIVDDASKFVNIQSWANAGKTDDFVRDALGIEKKLSGAELMAHPKFKILQEFLDEVDARKVKAWINKDTPTDEVWRVLGLDKLTKEELKESNALKTYIRYATKLDDDIWNHKRASFEPEISSPAELSVKVRLWANAGRPSWYVFEMMGKNAMKGNSNYKYYKLFLRLIQSKQQHPVI